MSISWIIFYDQGKSSALILRQSPRGALAKPVDNTEPQYLLDYPTIILEVPRGKKKQFKRILEKGCISLVCVKKKEREKKLQYLRDAKNKNKIPLNICTEAVLQVGLIPLTSL